MKTTTIKKLFSTLFALALLLGLFPFGPFAPRTAKAADDVTIDLSNVITTSSDYDYNNATGIITVTGTHATVGNTVTITGDGTNGGAGYSIIIEEAEHIDILAGTTILGVASSPALTVLNGAVVYGNGADISITSNALNNSFSAGIYAESGDVTIAGTLGNITGRGGTSSNYGIYAENGNVYINGTVGDITGEGGFGYGIYANGGDVSIVNTATVGDITGSDFGIMAYHDNGAGGNVTIAGAVGNITGTAGADGTGIRAEGGNVTISGTVTGNITGAHYGIYAEGGKVTIASTATVTGNITGSNYGIMARRTTAGGDVEISGTVGAITGGGTLVGTCGIYAENGSVVIPGTVGDIFGGDYGIYAKKITTGGNVTIPGKVGNITGGISDGIFAEGDGVFIPNGETGNITGARYGIFAEGGDVAISGTAKTGDITGNASGIRAQHTTTGGIVSIINTATVGNITGTTGPIPDGIGIHADGRVTISGTTTTVGNITGAYIGISANGNLTITDTVKVGNISGGSSDGIYVYGGNLLITPSAEVGNITGFYGIEVHEDTTGGTGGGEVEITGRVGNITGAGAYDMVADVKYAVLDYVGGILRIAKCSPAGYTVTFNYGSTYPPNVPKCAYISGGNQIPDFAPLNATNWYTDSMLTPANQWLFAANTVNADTILYTSWPASFTDTTLLNATVGSYYSQTPAVTGSATITWAYVSGTLPPGLSFDANTGIISGTPTTTGTYSFNVTVSNLPLGSDTKLLTLTVVSPPPAPPSYGGGGSPYIPKTPVGEAQKPTFPIGGQVVGKRITVFKLEALKTTLFRLNKGETFTVLGLANGGRALFIEHNGRQGYIALKDIGITFEPPIKATAFKKAPAYIKLENGKLKRIGYYSVQQSLWIHGISGKYLINRQTGVTYYLDAGQWVLLLP